MKRLDNRVAIVTGAGAGMGQAITTLFLEEGARVLAADIDPDRLTALRDTLRVGEDRLLTRTVNVAREDEVEAMIAQAVEAWDTLDVLVNNAGVMDNFQPVADLDNATYERVMAVNVEGPFKAMRAALRVFLPKEQGVILNIASIGGLKGGVAGAAYTTSKHALIGLTRNTGYLYSKSGIRCNAIAPGAVETRIGETIDMDRITPLVNDRVMTGMALNPRAGQSDEIARAALFLVSDDASFVNGTVLTVDGGWSAY